MQQNRMNITVTNICRGSKGFEGMLYAPMSSIRQYREYYPTEIYANKNIIDANILVCRIEQETLESPYQTFQRFFYTHW